MTKYPRWSQEGDSGNREKLSGTKACRYPPIAIRSWRYRPSAILVEGAANGHALMSVLKRNRKLVHEITANGSKTARLRPHIETILSRQILLPTADSGQIDT